MGIQVRVKGVMTGLNIDGLPKLLDLCDQLEVEFVHLDQYQRSLWMHHDELFPTPEQLLLANDVIEIYRRRKTSFRLTSELLQPQYICPTKETTAVFAERTVCNAGRSGLTLLPNGEVSICEHLPYVPEVIIGDLRVQSIEEFWHSSRLLSFLSPPVRSWYEESIPCHHCAEQDFIQCHTQYSICLKDSYNYFRSLHAPDLHCSLVRMEEFRLA
jgi:MoaA/NifB/PqqE/SkfB family radical SAM enzyme